MSEDAVRRIDEIMPQIRLYVAMAEHSEGEKHREKLARVATLLDRLEAFRPG